MADGRQIVFHPFLFALYPILFLYSHNVNEVFLSYIIFPAALALLSASILLMMLMFAFGDLARAGLGLLVLIVLFFSFGPLMTISEYVGISDYSPLFFLYGVAIGFSYLVLKGTRRNLTTATKFLNVMSIALVLIPTSSILLHGMPAPGAPADGNAPEVITTNSTVTDLPDIYYIILDGYARSDILMEVYGFDNGGFISELEDRGFYVAQKSRSNYATTHLSLASSLNMEYIPEYLEEELKRQPDDTYVVTQMMKDNNVSEYLKSRGYVYINLKSTYSFTDDMNADLELGYSPHGERTGFYAELVESTLLQPFRNIIIGQDLWKSRLYAFEKLEDIPEMEGPTFTFAHMVLPHPPYLFDRHGNQLPKSKLAYDRYAWGEGGDYVEQSIFVHDKISEAVGDIISTSDAQPIIVIQADHGVSYSAQMWEDDARKIPVEKLEERVAILNAYYLPDGGNELLYDTITPVNTFRIIFNHYFGENYPMLDDESYYSTYVRPYDFLHVEK